MAEVSELSSEVDEVLGETLSRSCVCGARAS